MPPGVGLCEGCNPLGLRDAASSQVHGTVFVALVGAIIALAVVARLAVTGAGPFPASVDGVIAAEGGLAVTLTVSNEGAAMGRTTCRVADAGGRTNDAALVLTPRIEAAGSITFERTLTELGTAIRPLVVTCRTP